VPNLGALTAGSNAGAAATKPAEVSTASGNRDQASVFIVEIVGYGGGEGQGAVPANGDAKPDGGAARSLQPGGGQGQVAGPASVNKKPDGEAASSTQPRDEEKKKP